MEYSQAIVKTLEQYFQEQDWSYSFDPLHGVFTIEADLACKLHSTRLVIQVQEDSFVCFAALPVEVPALLRAQVGEYLHRANFGLPVGNFAFDYDDGSVHFKTHFFCATQTPDAQQLEACIGVPLTVIERYGDGLLSLIAQSTASKAIEQAEQA